MLPHLCPLTCAGQCYTMSVCFHQIIPESSGLIQTDASTDDNRVALHTTYLRLVNITEEAEAEYQCGFKNEFGQDFSNNVPLHVLGKYLTNTYI